MEHLGQRFYLAASDYVFPRAANTLIKKQLIALGAELVGEYYLPLSSQAVKGLIDDIAQSKAEVILNTTNVSMEAAYLGVHLWARAVSHANTDDASTVRQALKGQTYPAPEGIVTVSGLNNHLWKPLHIGQIQADGQFKIVRSLTDPIRPLPYPSYRTPQAWQRYLNTLYLGWGGALGGAFRTEFSSVAS